VKTVKINLKGTAKVESLDEMSCLEKSCKDCEWMVIHAGKLKCNLGNRLGLRKEKLK